MKSRLLTWRYQEAEELGQVREGMEEVAARTDEISSSIEQRKTELIGGAVEEISDPLAQLNTLLDQVQSSLVELIQFWGRPSSPCCMCRRTPPAGSI